MISSYLIRNPQMVWLLLLTTLIAGISCLYVMPRHEDPILKRRVAVVGVTLAGAGAEEIESTVTIPIEKWLREFPVIKQIRSNTRANVANIVVELADDVDQPAEIWSAIERKLQANTEQLPSECGIPQLTVFPLKAFSAIVALVPSDNQQSLPQISRLAHKLQTRVLNLGGTESAELFGSYREELAVIVSPGRLAESGLTTAQIADQIRNSRRLPVGNLESNGNRLPVEIDESSDLQSSIEDLPIKLPGRAESVQLRDIATIQKQMQDPATEQAIIEGVDSIVLGVLVDDRTRIDYWTDSFRQIVTKFERDFPGNYSVRYLFLQDDELQQRMHKLLQNILFATLAVVAMVFLFMGWRCMLVVAISLPLSTCLVVCGLRWLEIPIHQMSVTGLIVALGLLIDNSIVMVEEVRSRLFQGKNRIQAMSEAVGHLGMPLLGSTLTTVLAFIPIATLPGPSGEFVGALAVSVILAVASSLLLALTVVPPLVFLFGVSVNQRSLFEYGINVGVVESLYRQSLRLTFQFPLLGMILGVTMPLTGFYVANQLPKQFFPATDRKQIQIEVELASSKSLAAVRQTVESVRDIVATHENIEAQSWFLGKSAPTFYYNVVPRRRSTPTYAQAMIDLNGDYEIDSLVNQLQRKIDAQIFEARVIVRKLEQGPPFDAPVEVRLLGEDSNVLKMLGDDLRYLLARQDDITHTRSDLGDTVPKLQLMTDAHVIKEIGYSRQDVSKFLHSQLSGALVGKYFDRGAEVSVNVKVDVEKRSITDTVLSTIIAMPAIRNSEPIFSDGKNFNERKQPAKFPVGSLGSFELVADSGAIVRLDGQRMNEIKAYLRAGVLPSRAIEQFKQDLLASDFRLPDQYRLEFGGEDEKRSHAVSTLAANAVVIIAILVVSLVAVMGSFRLALIVASVGGLAIGLGPLALYAFQFPFGFMAIVGTMGLVGIAINDTIVVLAAIREYEAKCISDHPSGSLDSSAGAVLNESRLIEDEATLTNPAINDSNSSDLQQNQRQPRDRLVEIVFNCTRHILATTFTTMIGFLPLVIDGGRFWPPLAIVISAGVGGATLLALYFAPSFYIFLQRR